MTEIKWVTPIATATAIAKLERKRELEKVSALFELWRKQHPHDTELWFLTVTCSYCPYLYFGSAIMLVTYFSKF